MNSRLKPSFWDNPDQFTEIPVGLEDHDTSIPCKISYSKKFYRKKLIMVVVISSIIITISIIRAFQPNSTNDLLALLFFWLIFMGIAWIEYGRQYFDNKPVILIDTYGLETKKGYLSWRDAEDVYLEKRGNRLYLVAIKQHDIKEDLVFPELEISTEELASLIGAYYTAYLKRREQKI